MNKVDLPETFYELGYQIISGQSKAQILVIHLTVLNIGLKKNIQTNILLMANLKELCSKLIIELTTKMP